MLIMTVELSQDRKLFNCNTFCTEYVFPCYLFFQKISILIYDKGKKITFVYSIFYNICVSILR